jgi:CheY-like chemotaxis protein
VKRILFVDDESRVLSGLRRQLFARRGEWDMAFAESGPAALEDLARQPADAIVSDMRMPGMDGAQLLARVAQEHPRTARLVLSGHADADRVQVARSCAHRYLHKPCPPETLQSEVARALAVRESLDRLGWALAHRLWSTPPSNVREAGAAFTALAENADAEAVAAEVDRELSGDSFLAARVAALAAGSQPPRRALLPLILAVRFHDGFLADAGEPGWRRATALAGRATAVAAAESLPPEVALHAATAAVLAPLSDARGEPAARREILEYLLPTWGFADPVIAAVAHAAEPAGCPAPHAPVLALLAAAELLLGWADPARAPSAEREAGLCAWLKDRGWTATRERWPAATALPA